MEGYPEFEFFAGGGRTVERLSELKICFQKANHAYAYRYLQEWNRIVMSEETEEEMAGRDFNPGALNVKKLERKAVERFLATGLMEDVSDFVDEHFYSLGEENVKSMLFRQYIAMDTCITAAETLDKLGYESKELMEHCGDFKTASDVFNTTENTVLYLKKVLGTAIRIRDALAQKKYAKLIESAKEYIGQNFQNEDISLNAVAASVNLSPNYFSTIFSQEEGKTFVEYLTFVRMEKAKELIRNSNKKMTDIAFEVGYQDPHYFSYIFKKTQKCTPREYRAKG